MEWIKSSHSVQGNCVEVSFWENKVFLRDSKLPDGDVLCVGRGEWEAFITCVKAGEMDGPNGR